MSFFIISDDSYREILTSSVLFHPLSFVLYMYPDAILYGMLYLYTGPSVFDLIIMFMFLFISPIHNLVLFFFFFFFFLRQYVCVCHISFSGEGLEF